VSGEEVSFLFPEVIHPYYPILSRVLFLLFNQENVFSSPKLNQTKQKVENTSWDNRVSLKF
jgi:hypothetical protein